MRPARPAAWALLVCSFFAQACVGSPAQAPLREGEVARFADATAVFDLEVTPSPVDPTQPVTVKMRVEGPAVALRLGLLPAGAGSRQVALGGPNPPPKVVPADPRAVFVDFVGTGAIEQALELPQPWHASLATLTLQRQDQRALGPRSVPAVAGSRTESGVAILDLLDVATTPTHVRAPKSGPVAVDGVLDEPVWARAASTVLVASLDGEPLPGNDSVVRFAWTSEALLVGATLPDADLRGTHTQRDEPLWKEEAFELFVFGDASIPPEELRRAAQYIELQVSPRGVVFDAAFENYRKGDEGWNGEWQAAVDARGSVNDASDDDDGFTVEMRVPWTVVCSKTRVACDVGVGRELRVNVFRLERPRKKPTVGMALSPTRAPDFHDPRNSAVLELVQ